MASRTSGAKKNTTSSGKKNTAKKQGIAKTSSGKAVGTAKNRGSGTRNSGNNKRQAASRTKQNRDAKQQLSEYQDLQAAQFACAMALSLMVAVFLFACLAGVCGTVGGAIKEGLVYVFGWSAWLIPLFVFLGSVFLMANRENPLAMPKFLTVVAAALFLDCITGLFAAKSSVAGVFGSGIAAALAKALGKAGAGILLVAAFFLCLALVFGKRVMAWIREYNRYRDEMEDLYETEREQEDYIEPSYRILPKKQKKTKPAGFHHINLEENARIADAVKKQKELDNQVHTTSEHKEAAGAAGMSEITPDAPKKTTKTEAEDGKPIYKQELEKKFGTSGAVPPIPQEADAELPFVIHRGESVAEPAAVEAMPDIPVVDSVKEISAKPAVDSAKGISEKPAARAQKNVAKDTKREVPPLKTISVDEARKRMEAERAGNVQSVSDTGTLAGNTGATKPAVYTCPPVELLRHMKGSGGAFSDAQLRDNALNLQQTLESFGVRVRTGSVTCGPTVTRYELLPEQGVKVSKITSLADDLKLNLAAQSIRIEAPIPGKSAVGIEVPNPSPVPVALRDLIDSKEFEKAKSNTAFAVGKDIAGRIIVTDIAKMPHLLIAGATGSGKSVCINTLIMSILYKADPAEVKLIMIDPKVVELSVYNGIPHLYIPVVTDPKKAAGALNWAVSEMMERYQKFADAQVRNIKGYNEWVEKNGEDEAKGIAKMPQLIIIVDELADLMMVASKEVEDAICRLAQLARAAGIHLVIATQRPSVNVITGTIKANIPSRIAFSVSSAIDSRTILDRGGAEKLLGKGDMLFYPSGYSDPVRLQGAFVSDEEVASVVEYAKAFEMTHYSQEITDKITSATAVSPAGTAGGGQEEPDSGRDEYFHDAGVFIIEADKASVGMLQRKFSVGFNRAARIMDQLHEAGVVGAAEGTKPRMILMTLEEFEQMYSDA